MFHAGGVPVLRFVQGFVAAIAVAMAFFLAAPGGAGAATPDDLPGCRSLDRSIVKPDGSILAAGGADIKTSGMCSDQSLEHSMLVQFTSRGEVDKTFSDGGIRLFPASYGKLVELLPASGEAAVLVTSKEIMKIRGDGDFDSTFGGHGFAKLDGFLSGDLRIQSALTGPDGKIVVVAEGDASGALVARFTAGGQLDSSFGGDGVIEPVAPEPGATLRDLGTAGLDQQGRLLITATVEEEGQGPAVFRYLDDGTPDGSFGGGDGFSAPWTGLSYLYPWYVHHLVLTPAGDVQMYASSLSCCVPRTPFPYFRTAIFKMNPDGSAAGPLVEGATEDYEYRPEGYGYRASLVETTDGGVVQNGNRSFGFVKYLLNGTTAPGFDSSPLPIAPYGGVNGVAKGGDGTVIGVGSAMGGLAIAKVDATTGEPDPSFGVGGMVLLPANECEFGAAPPPPGSPVTPWNRCRVEPPPAPSARIAFRHGASRKPVVTGTASLPNLDAQQAFPDDNLIWGARLKIKLPQRLKLTKRFRSKLDLSPRLSAASEDVTADARVQGRSILVDVIPDHPGNAFSPNPNWVEWDPPSSTAVTLDFKFRRGAIKRIPRKQRRKPMNFRIGAEVLPLVRHTGAPSIYYGENSVSVVRKARPVKPKKRR